MERKLKIKLKKRRRRSRNKEPRFEEQKPGKKNLKQTRERKRDERERGKVCAWTNRT